MATQRGAEILACLNDVAVERAARALDAGLRDRVVAVKGFQRQRFAATYSDLLSIPRYAGAASFFLDDLYGPGDFTRRDEEFGRIVPPLLRLFPAEIVGTVLKLVRLHALSEQLDTLMAAALENADFDDVAYARAWRKVGRPADRGHQVDWMLAVGAGLDRYTRNPLMRHSLRFMRGPARAAGLSELQAFLERGFETFRAMKGATEFLHTIASRERDLARALFAGDIALAGAARFGAPSKQMTLR